MTIDEAIKYCEEVAEWLKELKSLKEQHCDDVIEIKDYCDINLTPYFYRHRL